MTDAPLNELLRSSINVVEKDPNENAWQESADFMDRLIAELSEGADFSSLEAVDISYNLPYEEAVKHYPKQVVAIIALNQPTWAKVWSGNIDPESNLIAAKRSAGRWGGETWAVPMGTIEDTDIQTPDSPLGNVIGSAAKRELDEEVTRESIAERGLIASSFLDKKTGKLIHVIFTEILESPINRTSLSVGLPDTREHESLGWIKFKDFTKLSPVTDNVKFLFVSALKYVRGVNQDLSASFKPAL